MKIKTTVEEFSALVPFFLGMLLENPDMAPPELQDFLSRAELMKTVINKTVRAIPSARRQFRLINSVFDFDENEIATIQIVPEGMKESREEKYLTRKKPYNINETIKRHMNKEKKLYG